jgi:hypothetical protein
MLRRLLLTTVLMASALPVWAQTRATYVLSNGERHNGVIVYGRGDNNLVDNKFHVNVSGNELVFERNDVAVIDFVGGTPDSGERSAVIEPGVMIMRDGSMKRGTLHDIRLGDVVQWVDEGGNRNDYPIGSVRRLYLKPDVAKSVYLNSTSTGVVTSNGNLATVVVNGNQQWTDSGLDVHRGDRVQFTPGGTIQPAPGVSVPPAGARQRSPNNPVPAAGRGGLIARVGDGPAFAISNTRDIVMPADGRLMLGINDDNVSDNAGVFNVGVRRR